MRSVLSLVPDGYDMCGELDKWLDITQNKITTRSVFTAEKITRLSLRERITELENMRDAIYFELDRLKVLVDGKPVFDSN